MVRRCANSAAGDGDNHTTPNEFRTSKECGDHEENQHPVEGAAEAEVGDRVGGHGAAVLVLQGLSRRLPWPYAQ